MGTIYGNEYKDHLTGLYPEKILHCFQYIKQDIRITLLNFSLWRMEKPWEVPPRRIDDLLLWIVRDGEFNCCVGDEKRLLRAGEGIIAGEDIPHGMEFAPGSERGSALVIHLKLRGCTANAVFDALEEPFFRLHFPEAFFHSLERAIALKSVNSETAGRIVTARLFEVMMDWMLDGLISPDKFGTGDARVREAMNFIYRNLNGNIGVADIAASVGLHEVRFREIFREQTGMTPLGFLKQVRLEKVSELLIKTLLPLSEIALMTGFNTASYLCSAFRAYSGIPPQNYRRIYQQRYQE